MINITESKQIKGISIKYGYGEMEVTNLYFELPERKIETLDALMKHINSVNLLISDKIDLHSIANFVRTSNETSFSYRVPCRTPADKLTLGMPEPSWKIRL